MYWYSKGFHSHNTPFLDNSNSAIQQCTKYLTVKGLYIQNAARLFHFTRKILKYTSLKDQSTECSRERRTQNRKRCSHSVTTCISYTLFGEVSVGHYEGHLFLQVSELSLVGQGRVI